MGFEVGEHLSHFPAPGNQPANSSCGTCLNEKPCPRRFSVAITSLKPQEVADQGQIFAPSCALL